MVKTDNRMTRDLIKAIEDERDFQDEEHGTIREHPHSVCEWMVIMRREMKEVEDAYFKRPSDEAMLDEIRQVVAVGVACMQQHGFVRRSDR